ncbi:MAG TPA: amylo-alpha-1,6-glucosidase [Kiritimatiellia bacterium]|nr:amylo-alpha-1,6-glucosidase [Kiritimatiellia bacterium]
MKITFDRSITNDIDQAMRREWLETNGLGGWAGSTIIGLNTRKYHAILAPAMNPPLGRFVLLSKLDETLIVDGRRLELGCNSYPGVIHPNGDQFLEKFEREWIPTFTYFADGIRIQKRIFSVYGQNTTVILYDVISAPHACEMELLPLIAGRDYHWLMKANDRINLEYSMSADVFHMKPYEEAPDLFIKILDAQFISNPNWYYQLEYIEELDRMQDFQEDLFSPGHFKVKLEPGALFGVVVSTDNPKDLDPFKLYDQEMKRRRELLQPFARNSSFIKTLALAADQFVVRRGKNLNTIIAGYPWFSDWGRDSMISLPGLCLTTGRYDIARKIIQAFAEATSEGMLPNRFPDEGDHPEYNTADATMWFFVTIYRYWQRTGDDAYVRDHLYPLLKDIIAWHDKGTRFNIHTDKDGLLITGTPATQLTWMDVRVGDWVVTPRHGKAVEINALWYNAFRIMALFAESFGHTKDAKAFKKRADNILPLFEKTFWNEETRCLYDYIDGDNKNADIRPNQLFAISLPFPLLTGDRAKRVLDVVDEHLFTPLGLRSLSPTHPDYHAIYEGDLLARDGAYHQGTVWGWLIGPYITALIKVRGKAEAASRIALIKKHMQTHFTEQGIGTIAEIFDGNPPHAPKGCFAQAWSVAELLRALIEDAGEN